ncbi:leucine-rich repeat domain-containing protein [Pelagicoccus sp. SDUM812003]|uniref:leucine-rich repeat domain-containing protein n=1 Tax=Pelagicoccus sp. SDUM812003 TaxID=3041267 RepID=UPI00280D5457|nr:leucine-rich repeat domain-containing protein [Pelagicoccus sp. SDUM812003]MDQ8204497.1 leucine-rich repeat domain-containing protein [Pelagicoccus sp. SDUM812003]
MRSPRFALLAFVQLSVAILSASGAEISIPDPNLEAVLREALAKPTGTLTDADLATLTFLDSSGYSLDESERISDLTGLNYAVNLEELRLDYHEIEDLSPLWTLESLLGLSMIHNRIASIGILAAIPQIELIDLRHNQIEGISALWGFDDLGYLDLSSNFIDLDDASTSSVVNHLQGDVADLDLSDQRTKSTEISSHDTVFSSEGGTGSIAVSSSTSWAVSADVDWIEIDPEIVSGFEDGIVPFTVSALPEGDTHRIGKISVEGVSVEISQGEPVTVEVADSVLEQAIRLELDTTVAALTQTHLAALTKLRITAEDFESPDAPLSSLSGLEHATNLEELVVSGSDVSSLQPILNLPNLQTLYIDGGYLSGPIDLSDASSLRFLTLADCGLTSLPSFSSSVVNLSLSGNEIIDLAPLAASTQLEFLSLSYNRISDISPIADLSELRSLYLDNNLIRDVGSLEGLDQLSDLQIYSNHLVSIESLLGLTALSSLGLHYNYLDLSAESLQNEFLQELSGRGVYIANTVQFSPEPILSDSSSTIGAEGGIGEIAVSCSTYWQATTETEWISVVGDASGFGDGVIAYQLEFAPDLMAPRTGAIEVNGVRIEITQDVEVDIPDPVLKSSLRALFGGQTDTIWMTDLASLTSLSINGSSSSTGEALSDLSGLEYAVSLESIDVTYSLIESLDPIRDLSSLRTIRIAHSELLDPGDLSGLVNLNSLDLSSNRLEAVPIVPASIQTLSFTNNQIIDISEVAGLSDLESLSLSGNLIEDISSLIGLDSLKTLYLNGNQVYRTTALRSLVGLQTLGLERNHLDSMVDLEELKDLSNLWISHNYIDFAEPSDRLALDAFKQQGVNFINGTTQNPNVTSIGPILTQIGQAGGSRTLSVAANSYWSASTDVDWITVVDGEERFSSGTLTLEIAAAPDLESSRTGTVKVGDNELSVAQYLDAPPLDPVVEKSVRIALDKPEGQLLEPDMEQLFVLTIEGDLGSGGAQSPVSLSGLEFATNLERLSVIESDIEDLAPISLLSRLSFLLFYKTTLPEMLDFGSMHSLDYLVIDHCGLEQTPVIPDSLTTLSLPNNQIEQLDSLEGKTSLTELYLSWNEISDLSSLATLTNLEKLSIDNNQVREIDPISSLEFLESLFIGDNHLRSIEALAGLSALKEVYLTNNYIDFEYGSDEYSRLETLIARVPTVHFEGQLTQVYKVEPLGSLVGQAGAIRRLSVFSTTFWDVGCDAEWIEILGAEQRFGNDIVEYRIAPAAELSERRTATIVVGEVEVPITQYLTVEIEDRALRYAIRSELGIAREEILDVDLERLTYLSVGQDSFPDSTWKVERLDGLENASNLEHLSLRQQRVASLTPIANHKTLNFLQISENEAKLGSIESLEEMDNLEILGIYGSGLAELPTLPAGLKTLAATQNEISDLEPLRGLEHLRYVEAARNDLSNLNALKGLTSLEYLYLAENRIDDISGLAGLTNLEELTIFGNRVRDLRSLSGLPKLKDLNLSMNHVRDLEGLEELPSLLKANLSLNFVDAPEGSRNSEIVQKLIDESVGVTIDTQQPTDAYLDYETFDTGYWESEYAIAVSSLTYWSVSVDQPWVEVSTTEGFGIGHFTISLAENPSDQSRIATVVVEGSVLEIRQNGSGSELSLSISHREIGFEATQFEVEVTSDVHWTAGSDSSWLTLQGREGFGSSAIRVSVAPNYSNAKRTAVVSIGPKTLTVVQRVDAEYFLFLDTLTVDATQEINWPAADADGDGASNIEEFIIGTDPFDAASKPVLKVTMADETLSLLSNVGRSGVSLTYEYSEDIVNWQTFAPEASAVQENGLVRAKVTYPEGESGRFYRVGFDRQTVSE